ncbi:hypothetical protein V8C42DRAFT_44758 [Trichoderma barbatum]
MFSQPVSPTAPGLASTVSPSPSRTSRLRGLSILRNYTHNHLLSRDNSHHANGSNSNNNSGGSSPSTSQSGNGLTRSVSYSPVTTTTTTTTTSNAAASPNRLTLVATSPDSSRTPQPRATATSPASNTPASPFVQASASSSSSAADTPSTIEEHPAMARSSEGSGSSDNQPSIRFSAYYDPRSTRPSLSFPPVSRTLSNGAEIIRVGRYSERDSHALSSVPGSQAAAAPVGFKSKVVSRRHCEFWYENGKWFIKDVKSSSGTFLNHIRLSPPSQESKAFPVNDGDIVQLGIDFKGGEEMIFRCVKMRLELNRGWQNKPNTFNMAAHKRLRTMATTGGASVSNANSQDCSICLNSIAPCQSLFVAPCSHTWHFKCVRALLTSPQYPIFICPNCRAGADLEADVEDPSEEWQNLDDFEAPGEPAAPTTIETTSPEIELPPPSPSPSPSEEPHEATVQETDTMDMTVNITAAASPVDSPADSPTAPHATSEPLPIRGAGRASHLRENGTPSPPGSGAEGLITPRNNAGPWVFDGMAGRRPANGTAEMPSLDSAADADMTTHESSDDSASR